MARYDAFISYSRGSDAELAPKIRDGLQKLAKPWNKRRALNIFLDQASLEVSTGLKDSLEAKLGDTEWLVLMLSEESAASQWVGAEIDNWLASRPRDRVLLVHSGGELAWGDGDWDWERSTAAPRALSGIYDEEPLWLDLRKHRGSADLDIRTNAAFKDDLASLAATLHGKSKEDIVGEDLVQYRRAKRLRRAAITGLAVLTVAAVIGAVVAVQNAREANRQRAIAETEAAIASSRLAAASATNLTGGAQHDAALLLAAESYRLGEGRVNRGAGETLLNASTSQGFAALQATVAHWPGMLAPLRGHDGDVTAVAISADGSTLASADAGGRVVLWDTATGQRRGELELGGTVATEDFLAADLGRPLALNGDGSVLAAAVDEGARLVVRDVPTGQSREMELTQEERDRPVREFGMETAFEKVSLSTDGSHVMAARIRGLALWDATTGARLATPLDGLFVDDAVIGPDGTMFVVSADGATSLRAVADPDTVVAQVDRAARFGGAFAPDGSRVALAGSRVSATSGREEAGIWIWEVARSEWFDEFPIDTTGLPVSALAFRADGGALVGAVGTIEGDQQVTAWAPREIFGSDRLAATPAGLVAGTAFGADGSIWAVAPIGGSVIRWDAAGDPAPGRRIGAGPSVVSSDGSAVAVAGTGVPPQVRVVTADQDFAVDLPIPSWGDLVEADIVPVSELIGVSPGGTRLAAAVGDRILLWEIGPDDPVPTSESVLAEGVGGELTSPGPLVFSPDGGLLAYTTGGGVVVWDVAAGEVRRTLAVTMLDELGGGFVPPSDVVFSADGERIAVNAAAATLWDTSGDAPPANLGEVALAIALSPDGAELASTASSCATCGARVEILDAGTGAVVRASAAAGSAGGDVRAMAYSPDGSLLVTGDFAGVIRVWDAAGARLLGSPFLAGHQVTELAFTGDDASLRLVSTSPAGAVAWDFSAPAWTEWACELAGRNLTGEEWEAVFGPAAEYHETCPGLGGAPAAEPVATTVAP